jgi:hypothetical protein
LKKVDRGSNRQIEKMEAYQLNSFFAVGATSARR